MSVISHLSAFLWGIIVGFALYQTLTPAHGRELFIASVYGDYRDATPNRHLRALRSRVATGAAFDPNGNTVAHKTLPLGTKLTLKRGHRTAVVTVNDRGPFVRGRTFDLTPAVNKRLLCYGLCRVRVEPWPPLPKPKPSDPSAEFAWGEE